MIKKYDFIIAIIVLVISLAGYFITGTALAGSEKIVIIELDGEMYAEYPMSEHKIIDVNGHNTVEITSEYVRVTDADCPDKLDVKQGKIKNPGSIIICLPNKMTVRIAGESEFDAISY